MGIIATCLTIAAALAAANGGERIELRDAKPCPPITIGKDYAREIVVDAGRTKVVGLVITGTNITFNGGRLAATGGVHGAGPSGYAVRIQGAANVRFENGIFTAAKKGAVVDSSRDVAFVRNDFTRLGDDGLVVARTRGLLVDGNLFELAVSKPTECALPGGEIRYSLASRDCTALGGKWKDGYHPDAVQMFNDVQDALIQRNNVRGEITQGIGQQDSAGMLPLQRITIRWNSVITGGAHPITLRANCVDCSIRENEVLRWPGSSFKKIIIPGAAFRCGNIVQDEKVQDAPCDR